MRCRERSNALISCVLLVLVAGAGYVGYGGVPAEELDEWHKGLPRQYKSKWLVSDRRRPLPVEVTPGAAPGAPPSDAIVLFDGKDLSRWRKTGSDKPAGWKVEGGAMEMNNTGSISTKETFLDCQVHLEWRTPSPPRGDDQARGNSGVFFMDNFEIQVLDSYKNKTYADGSAAAVYAQHPPLVNACRPPGEWQTYDIVWRAPRFKDKKVVEPARVTLLHNGVVVQHNAEIYGKVTYRGLANYDGVPEGPLSLGIQDHGDGQPMRFRNIWIRRLDLSPEPTE
jgi:hypothetical protein